MRRTHTAAALAALTLTASVALVACGDDQPACAATLTAFGPGGGGSSSSSSRSSSSGGGGSSSRSTTTRSYSTNRDRAGTTGSTGYRSSTSGNRPPAYRPPAQPKVTVKVKKTTVNNQMIIVQPRPVVRNDGFRQYPAYGLIWYPPGVYPPDYHVTYNCYLPADAVEGDWDQ